MNNTKMVLVISDRHEQFSMTASILRNDGYSVRFASSVSDGLPLTFSGSTYLIISELAVPDVDGLRLCRIISGDRSRGKIPVLLVGDLSKRSSIVADGYRCGAAGYVQKPIDSHRLADACRSLLDQTAFSNSGAVDRHPIYLN